MVRLHDILKLLKERDLDQTRIDINIRINNKLSKKLLVSTDISQSYSLRPVFFNITIDDIIKEIKTAGRGYRMEKNETKIICYVLSEDEDNL